jgi:hypothetical protein
MGGGASLADGAPARSGSIDKERAIRVALAKLLNHAWFAPFPRRVGRIRCEIPSGGVNAGSAVVPGFCQTRVSIGRTYVTVAFTQVWDSRSFTGERGVEGGWLTHTWIVIESKRLRPLDIGTFGDFPPQWVR